MSLAALAVMAGHAYPVFLGFKGGKAVASFVGAFLCLTPWALAVETIVFVVVVVRTRHISMGSIVGAATLPAGGMAGGKGSMARRGGFRGGWRICYLQA